MRKGERKMTIDKIMVIGAGQMGSGIAQVAAQAGFQVILQDIKAEYLARGIKTIEKISLDMLKKAEFQKRKRSRYNLVSN